MDKLKIAEEIIDYCKTEDNYSYYDMKAYAYANKPEWVEALQDRSIRGIISTYLKSARYSSGKKYKTPLYESMEKCVSASVDYYRKKEESEKVGMMIIDEIAYRMKIIENLSKELGDAITSIDYYVEDMGCPHKQPSNLPKGYSAVYMFVLEQGEEYEFLKIGKANSKSKARFTSQHYGFSAPSTLANSLCNDPDLDIDSEKAKEWMMSNLRRINIYIKSDCGKAATELVEAVMHYAFRPKYEGNI